MKSIRIGNDIRIVWPIVLSGDVSKLKDLDLTVEVRPSKKIVDVRNYADSEINKVNSFKKTETTILMNGGIVCRPDNGSGKECCDVRPLYDNPQTAPVKLPYTIENNTLIAIWPANKQFATGDYDIVLYGRKNTGGQTVCDQYRFVRLVSHTAQIDNEDNCGIEPVITMQPTTVELSGLSAYEVAVLEGFSGTREEWVESLKQPAKDAASEAEENFKTYQLETDKKVSEFVNRKVTPEMLSESTKQLIEASGGGTITNLADDEDIESVNDGTGTNVLKFKDRAYSPSTFSGKGYKILRKNIVDGKNVLTQDMINEPNTRYVIQYDYDLNGEEITIPEGCILNFQGGSLNNGTLIGTNTEINAGLIFIFNNIVNNGTYNIDKSFPEWFGAKTTSDDTVAIQKAFDIKAGEVYFSNGIYKISSTINSEYSNAYCNGGVIIQAISEIDYMFIFNFYNTANSVETLAKHKYFFGINASLDCNNKAKTAVGIKYCEYFKLYGFTIKNATHYSLVAQYYDYTTNTSDYTSGNVFFDTLYIANTIVDVNRVALLANRADSRYNNLTIVNFRTYIKIQSGCRFINVHGWAYLSDIVENSVLFSIETYDFISFIDCEADTIKFYVTFTLDTTKTSYINPKQFSNEKIYNGELFFAYYNNTTSHKINIINSQLQVERLIFDNSKQLELLNINCTDISSKLNNSAQGSPNAYTMTAVFDNVGRENDLSIVNGQLLYKYNNKWRYARNGETTNLIIGNSSSRPTGIKGGYQYFDTDLNKPIWWKGTQWVDSEGNDADSTPITSGTFANKPTGVNVGYAYFCTDKQTTEGTTNGIMIYYKGDNVWVDALGRIVS